MTDHSTLTLDADFLSLRKIGPWLHTVLPGTDEGPNAAHGSIELAIHELAANSIDHANPEDGKLHLSAHIDGGELAVELRDRGSECQVENIPVPDPENPQVRGYGMMIIEQLASSLKYERVDDSNVWTARFPAS